MKQATSDIRAAFPRSWKRRFLRAQALLGISTYSGVAQHAILALFGRIDGENLPAGASPVPSGCVYLHEGRIVVTAEPDEVWPGLQNDDGPGHNCDAQGCRQEHVIGRIDVRELARSPRGRT